MLSTQLTKSLTEITHSYDIELAVQKIFKEYLELKVNSLSGKISEFEKKYKMTFEQYEKHLRKKTNHSFKEEQTYNEWDEAVTLYENYQKIKKQWK